MFWRRTSKALGTPDTTGTWDHRLVDIPAPGEETDKVWAHILAPDQPGGRLRWQIRCDAFRRATVDLCLHIQSDVGLRVSCNGHSLFSGTLSPEPVTGATTISVDLGDVKDRGADCTLDLQVQRQDTPTDIHIPAEGPQAPRLVLTPDAAQFFTAALYFAAAWVAIFSLLVVAVILSGAISDPRLSAVLAVAAPLVGFFGIRDVSKLSLRRIIRRGFGALKSRVGILGSAGVAVCAAFLAVGAALVLDISWKKFRYAEGITPYLDTAATPDPRGLRDLLVAEPWRREAQILFEQKAVERRENRDAFLDFVRVITDDHQLRAVIAGTDGTLPRHLTGAAGTVWDPVRWYASMLPEGDAEGEYGRMKIAIDLLEGRTDCGARLHRQVLKIEHFRGNPDPKMSSEKNISHFYDLVEELTDIIENRPIDCDTYEHSLQLAQDMLAYVAAIQDHELATQYWNDLLQTRKATHDADRYWRSPDKLVLYQIFRAIVDAEGTFDPSDPKHFLAERILSHKASENREFRELFMERVYDRNPAFTDLVEWEKGTVVDVPEAQIETMLTKGWRF